MILNFVTEKIAANARRYRAARRHFGCSDTLKSVVGGDKSLDEASIFSGKLAGANYLDTEMNLAGSLTDTNIPQWRFLQTKDTQ